MIFVTEKELSYLKVTDYKQHILYLEKLKL